MFSPLVLLTIDYARSSGTYFFPRSVHATTTSANSDGPDLAIYSHEWPGMGPSGRSEFVWQYMARREQIGNLRVEVCSPYGQISHARTRIWPDLVHLYMCLARSHTLLRMSGQIWSGIYFRNQYFRSIFALNKTSNRCPYSQFVVQNQV